jgi:hypothetical protein
LPSHHATGNIAAAAGQPTVAPRRGFVVAVVPHAAQIRTQPVIRIAASIRRFAFDVPSFELKALRSRERARHRDVFLGEMAASIDHRASAAHWLAQSLRDMRQFAATEIACNWALSHQAAKRLTLAVALASPFPLVGDDVVLDHLAHDRVGAIRRAARYAKRIRMQRNEEEDYE